MQHKITTQKGEWLLVELPEGSTELVYTRRGFLSYRIDIKNSESIRVPKSGKLIGTTKDITEDIAKKIVEDCIFRVNVPVRAAGFLDRLMFVNYTSAAINSQDAFFDTAIDSFHSLLASHNVDVTNNYAILKIK